MRIHGIYNKKKLKKYSLKRRVVIATLTSAAILSIYNLKVDVEKKDYPFSNSDYINYIPFKEELENIAAEENHEFSNTELQAIIDSQKDTLENQNELEIQGPLQNNDLSELKYVKGLQNLHIYNCDVDLNDLKYNQELLSLDIENCTISHTESLPNTILCLSCFKTECSDNAFVIPYFLKDLYITESTINNLTLKTKSNIEELNLYGQMFIDLATFSDCENLNTVSIQYCANIKNEQVLQTLPNLKTVTLDDYAPIWMSKETATFLPLENQDDILSEIEQLDNIASEIVPDSSISNEEKITAITIYTISKLEYDQDYEEKIYDYNNYPIRYALNSDVGICINYATLFQALCNRVGVDSYELFSDVHTWNMVQTEEGYKAVDSTDIDENFIVSKESTDIYYIGTRDGQSFLTSGLKNNLYFYEIDLDELSAEYSSYNATRTPQKLYTTIEDLGYIENDIKIKITYRNTEWQVLMNEYVRIWLALMLIGIALDNVRNKKHQESPKLIKVKRRPY